MKKNKIVMSVISGLLVAAVAVGGTLAYLSDKSNMVTNTFNVGEGYTTDDDGHVGLWLDETANPADGSNPTEISYANRTEVGVEYKELYPGDVVAKDPTFHLTDGSIESYVFARVTGADAMIAAGYVISDIDLGDFDVEPKSSVNETAWEKVADDGDTNDAGFDGIYMYRTTVGGTQPYEMASLFNSVKLSKDVDNEEFAAIQPSTIDIQGVAVQASNNSQESAQAEAETILS